MTAYPSPSVDQLSPHFPQYDITAQYSGQLPFTYLMNDKGNGKRSILHVVPKEYAPSIGWDDNFWRKAQQAVKLQHPGLLKVEQVVDLGEYLCIVSESSEDPAMEQIKSRLPLPPREALIAVKSLANGMKLAHDAGLVHGRIDITTIHTNYRNFCRLLPINLNPQRTIPAEKDFYSPESLRKGTVKDISDDIYSFGVILYWLLTGSTPVSRNFVMPSSISACSKGVDRVVAKAVSGSKYNRYTSMGMLASDIDLTLPDSEKEQKLKALPGQKSLIVVNDNSTLTYFVLIPILLLSIVMAYLVLQYKTGLSSLKGELNELIIKNSEKAAQEQ